jgi:hypothetical protein
VGDPAKAGTAITQVAAAKTKVDILIIVLLEALHPKMIFDETTWHRSTLARLIGCTET